MQKVVKGKELTCVRAVSLPAAWHTQCYLVVRAAGTRLSPIKVTL